LGWADLSTDLEVPAVASDLTRRGFLGRTAATGLGIVFAGSVDAILGHGSALAASRSSLGYGDLIADPAGLLALPPGFSYKIVSQAGVTPTTDGVPAASDADGGILFANIQSPGYVFAITGPWGRPSDARD
jgi:hypothetical protein